MKIQFKVNRPLMPGDYILTLNPAHFHIKNVIFNNPATIVIWGDDTKTVVKCANEDYDPEKGLAMAIAKKVFGNEGNYYNVFKKWLPAKTEETETEPAREATPYEKAVENLKRSLLGFTFGGAGK
jgi:hypothetical protein